MVAVLPHAVVPSHQEEGVVGALLEYFGEVLGELPDFDVHHGVGKGGGGVADVVDPQEMGHNEIDIPLVALPAEVVVEVIVDDLVAGVEIVNVEGVSADRRVVELVEFDPGVVPEDD